MNVAEMFNSCRLCLGKSSSYVDIFEANGVHGFRAAEVINEILQLDVFKDDGFPEIICNQCLTKIIEFKRFKCICLESKHKLQYAIAQKNGINPKYWTSNWYYSYNIQETNDKEKVFGLATTEVGTHPQTEEICVEGLTNIKASPSTQVFWTNDGASVFNTTRGNIVPQVEVLMGSEIKGEAVCAAEPEDLAVFQAHGQNSKTPMYVLERIPKPEIEIPKISLVKNEAGSTKAGNTEMDVNSNDSCIVEYVSSANALQPCIKLDGGARSNLNIGELIYKYEPVDSTLLATCTEQLAIPRIQTDQISLVKSTNTPIDQEKVASKSYVGSQGLIYSQVLASEGISPVNMASRVPTTVAINNFSVAENTVPKCDECGKEFTDEASLTTHLSSGECEVKIIYCIKCKKNISGLKRFQKHLTWCGIYQCPVCKNVFKGKEATRDHVRSHFPNRRYACNFCFERFEGRNELILHVSNQHGNRTYKCDGCDKAYLKKVQYKKHILKCSKNVFICNACNSPYMRKYPLKLHIWKYHMSVSISKCKECGQGFKDKSEYENHILSCNIKNILGKMTYKVETV
ncbi:uncharacterized protein [Hetaerina americana]|uniref:uncharacterized protein isoform X1 n=1 Tax=Hetaerina americana TaxID=62018 RepID=UPI003A7F2AA7